MKAKSTYTYTSQGRTVQATRRNRKLPPQPGTRFINLKERDLVLFKALNTHGPLPSDYLYELTKHEAAGKTYFLDRLTQLYHGYCANPRTHPDHKCVPVNYLTRPAEYWYSLTPDNQHVVHDLNDRALAHLSNHGIRLIHRGDDWWHRLHNASISASFQIAHKGFKTQDDIYNHPSCPEQTKDAETPLALPLSKGKLIPDNLIALDYGGKSRRLLIETDRGTEGVRTNLNNTTFGRKLQNYIEVMENGIAKEHWGFSQFTVATVAPSFARVQTMIKELHRVNGSRYASRFIFRVIPQLSDQVVPPLYTDILQGWVDGNGKMVDLSQS